MENKVMINKCKAKERSWGLDGRLCQLFSLGHVTVSDDCDAASRGAADTVWRCELHLLVWGIRLRLWQNPALEMPTELINNTNSCQRGGVRLTTFFFFFLPKPLKWSFLAAVFLFLLNVPPLLWESQMTGGALFSEAFLAYFKLREISLNLLRRC